jgi:phosphate starvation-inducible PhoH-like protein
MLLFLQGLVSSQCLNHYFKKAHVCRSRTWAFLLGEPMNKNKKTPDNVVSIEDDFRTVRDRAIEKEYSIRGKTPGQNNYIETIKDHLITLGVGPAGTGKSHIALVMAGEALASGETQKIIMLTPAVECGEKKGFLPGNEQEKISPYTESMLSILREAYGTKFVNDHLERESISARSISYIRGTTFRDAWVILDEAQNTTKHEMKTFLTRIGENCKVIINGDTDQVDIKEGQGLIDAIQRISGIDEVGVHSMTDEDSVRSEIVRKILACYND